MTRAEVFASVAAGSTHDDITYEAIAASFGRSTEYHKETLALIEKHSKGTANVHRMRMARFPEGAQGVCVCVQASAAVSSRVASYSEAVRPLQC